MPNNEDTQQPDRYHEKKQESDQSGDTSRRFNYHVLAAVAAGVGVAAGVADTIKKKKTTQKRRIRNQANRRHGDTSQTTESPEPILFVAVTRHKDFSDDPVMLFQNASAYWVGSQKEWEDGPKSVNLPMETLQKSDIASLLAEDLLLITYLTECPPKSVPQNRFNIQAFFRHKKGLQPTYQKLPRHEHSIMDTFLKYFKG